MLRRIIHIEEEKCTGCGICADACHEGAIGMVDGKAKLLRDDYCDGLGDCLPTCPTGAITFEEREAAAYDEVAVKKNMAAAKEAAIKEPVAAAKEVAPEILACGCPGTQSRKIQRESTCSCSSESEISVPSQLQQWPVQIKLVPIQAPYFQGADLLIAADCTAYAYGNFHQEFIRGKMTLVGCPKLDQGDYSEKLTEIFRDNDIKSVMVTRMEVPCCGGLEHAAITALQNSGKNIPLQIVTISTDGKIL